MEQHDSPMGPDEAARRFAAMLDAAGLPRFTSTHHDREAADLALIWDNGCQIHLDLSSSELEPLDDCERASILGEPLPCGCDALEPIHVYVAGAEDGPRSTPSIPGVVVHRGPPMHPDDLTRVDGLPVTSPSRTLIDMAEHVGPDELRAMFARARAQGLLDPEAMRAARARVEWRPSLAMLDAVIEEFCG